MPGRPAKGVNWLHQPMSLDRRTFLNRGAAALAGTALSYSRIQGANERISLAHIGVGDRGSELAGIVSHLKDRKNVEMTAVCDLWKFNRERAAASAAKVYGRPPRSFQYFEDVLPLKDVDAVIISTPDFAHSPILKLVVEAGKDAYCEKPMGNVLEEAKAARDAVLAGNRIVQIGTQHRSEPYQIATASSFAPVLSARSPNTKSSGTTTARAGVAVPRSSRFAKPTPTGAV